MSTAHTVTVSLLLTFFECFFLFFFDTQSCTSFDEYELDSDLDSSCEIIFASSLPEVPAPGFKQLHRTRLEPKLLTRLESGNDLEASALLNEEEGETRERGEEEEEEELEGRAHRDL